MNLFIKEDFISHAGLPLTWKVECDALTEKDYEALAKIVSEKLTFCDVKGIPRGGIPFEKALKKYCTYNESDPLLICDDVYTTGTSMREVYEEGAIGEAVTLPATKPVKTYPVYVEDGHLYIEMNEDA